MSLASLAGASDRHRSFDAQFSIDESLEVRRLRRNLLSLIAAHPGAECIGDDDIVSLLANEVGLGSNDRLIVRIRINGNRHTLVCVPDRVWRSDRARLLQLKRAANAARRGCVLVHEGFVQRQPRLSNARTIQAAAGITVTAEDRMAILLHLVESGYSTLFDCACVLSNPSPFSCVLALVAEGVLTMRMDRRLGPNTRIDIADVEARAA